MSASHPGGGRRLQRPPFGTSVGPSLTRMQVTGMGGVNPTGHLSEAGKPVTRPRFEVVVRRASSGWGGWWEARIARPRIEGMGRSLAGMRRAVRALLAQEIGDAAADHAELVETMRLPAAAQRALEAARAARAERAGAEAAERTATAEALRALRTAKVGLRDIGELLGVSPQRAQQILANGAGGET